VNPLAAALNQDEQDDNKTDACDDPNQTDIVHIGFLSNVIPSNVP